MVTNTEGTEGIKNINYTRRGLLCVIEFPTNRNPAKSFQENVISVFGQCLYNSLPKYPRQEKC